ncbi:Ankyrin repeat domain-containing protein [Tetrabaena socialis]|uniref:Ankyrin repeat domain-containing protein n=1 Tax=Tetrabaena socialis TaxID=47790 RepID=A0A2J7ZZX3_9CHLO|nr:Ankyrin repeat domain-containing protein [Tetrabaena socialis]|eukprot:PNH05837.1 Ankyrin repeat domain-containing protein [Tetrabaena socialis]
MELQRAHKRQRRSQSPVSPPQQLQPAAAASDPSRIWLPELVERFARSLMPNEMAGTLRLVNKAAAAQFCAPQHATVRLSQPVPHHAFLWRWAGPGAMRCLTRKRRCELPCLTARSGVIANLEVLLARDNLLPVLDHDVFRAAAAAGQLDMCVWLRERGCTCLVEDALTAAAGGGQQAVCEWLLATGCPHHGRSAAAAARGGNVGLMDWLLLHMGSINVAAHNLLRGAAEGCDLPTLQRLLLTRLDTHLVTMPALYAYGLLQASARSTTADWQAKVEWLQSRGFPRTAGACTAAAAKADALPRLLWLRQRGYPLDMCVACSAAAAGNVEALQYVLGQGVEVHATMMRYAAKGGHMAVMQVLHSRGAPVGEETVRMAAAAGHLPAVAWLVERMGPGAALTASVFAAAAEAGSMELLAWLRARGCPWDATVFAAAAECGSEEQLEWLVEQGCPMGGDGAPHVRAVCHRDLAMLRCLQRLACPWGHDDETLTSKVSAVVLGLTHDSRTVLQRMFSWLMDQGCPVDWYVMEAAIGDKGDEAMMGWLQAQREQRARAGSSGLQSADLAAKGRCLRGQGCRGLLE